MNGKFTWVSSTPSFSGLKEEAAASLLHSIEDRVSRGNVMTGGACARSMWWTGGDEARRAVS